MKTLLHFLLLAAFTLTAYSDCPSADLTQDCRVDFEDFAVFASDWLKDDSHQDPNFMEFASQWMTKGVTDDPTLMPFVTIPENNFQMGAYEVTNGQFAKFLNAAMAVGQIKVVNNIVYALSDSSRRQPYINTQSCQIAYSDGQFTVRKKTGKDMSNYPAVYVGWYGAKAFCDFYDYRLPTVEEWKYAARGGPSDKRFPWGDTISHNEANYNSSGSYPYDISLTRGYHPSYSDGSQPYTAPVGSFAPNGYGLYDVAGNVEEWCNDGYESGGPVSETYRAIQGGSWASTANFCQIANYNYIPMQSTTYAPVGFRCILNTQIPVPDLVNMSFSDAHWAIQNSRFEVGHITGHYSNTVPAGKVISQNPAAGTMLLLGKTIDFVFSLGP